MKIFASRQINVQIHKEFQQINAKRRKNSVQLINGQINLTDSSQKKNYKCPINT
jgi:hypothetical protein